MLGRSDARASRERAKAWREKMRRGGLRPIQIWVPDIRSPEFVAEAHRQALLIAESEHEPADQGFIDSTPDFAEERGGI